MQESAEMKNKIFAILCIAILLLTNTTVYAKENTAGEVSNALGGIVSYKVKEAGAADAQSWLDGTLTEGAGFTSEWYVAGLTGSDTKYNFDSYKTALETFVNAENIQSATTREKYALLLILTGSDSKFIEKTADDSIGKAGIMSLIFGLHILNNGVESKEYTADKLVDEILSLRLSDGGWALMGKVSDVDVTAMTLSALAPYYESDETVKTSVDEALTLLSTRQNEAGDYAGFGKDNAESTAQVLFALSSLGIDAATDERFIKGENTVIDGLLKYKNADGSFAHEEGGEANESASAQSFYALTAYERLINGKGPLFIAEKTGNTEESKNEDSPIQGSEKSVSEGKSEDGKEPDKSDPDTSEKEHEVWEPESYTTGSSKSPAGNTAFSYKPIATGIVAALFALACLFFYLKKKLNKKNAAFLFIVACIITAFIWLTNIETKETFYAGGGAAGEKIGSVTMSITCEKLSEKYSGEYIPEDGVLLPATEFDLMAGESVYDILIKAAKEYNIQTESKGVTGKTGRMVYVNGIGYLYELQYGDLSGWMYKVNGKTPSVGCGEYEPANGDKIEWLYTLELGNDLD